MQNIPIELEDLNQKQEEALETYYKDLEEIEARICDGIPSQLLQYLTVRVKNVRKKLEDSLKSSAEMSFSKLKNKADFLEKVNKSISDQMM